MTWLHLAIISPFLLAILIPFLYRYARNIHTGWFVFLLPLALFAYFLTYVPVTSGGGTHQANLPWVPSLGIYFNAYVDGLSLLFALLITGIGALVVLYSIYYLSKKTEPLHNFYVYLMMFMGAMLGVVLTDNLIVIYVFWELTSLASSLLISYWFHRQASIYGAQKSMMITVFGGFSMLGGFSLLYVMTDTFSIQEIIAQADQVVESPLFLPAMLLILLGAFTKSAQFPFHIWLPDAMEAPTPVSAYLHSATMVKAGIYLVARLTPVFGGTPEWFWLLSGFGILTLTWGSISAVRQKDLKGILAFSTISQLGLIMCLLGLGSASLYFTDADETTMYATATLAAVFHLVNHATFKGSLFMTAGIVDHETGTRDIRKLGGLMTIMPVTFTVSLIGTAAMAGLPPFNGFLSKEMFFTGVLNATELNIFNMETVGFIFPVFAWIASIFTFLYCLIMFFRTFTGKFEPSNYEVDHVHEAPKGMLISPVILGSLVIIFGFFPNLLTYTILEPAMAAIIPDSMNYIESAIFNIYHWHGFNAEIFMTLGVVAFGALLFINMGKWSALSIYQKERDPLNRAYDGSLDGLITGSQAVTRIQMTGLLRDYFAFMLVFMVMLLLYSMFYADAFAINTQDLAPISPHMWVLTILFIAATLVMPFINHRVTAIITIGVIGFLLALFFVVFRAQDLAITQLLVETVLVILLLLAFYHLPEIRKETFKPVFKLTNAVISVAVGVTVTLIAFSAHAMQHERPFGAISEYFIENTYELTGGQNMVNLILVDFRAIDTILEVLVLAIAALGVVTMIKLRMNGREDV
ncbi:multisubunit sodium/proton antiporter MrpA subunit [Salsuginibacillus halophilus]|uniref:Multisubunit sodium/proton antiporter MrpA subunit n=1 Tax=Salsuginibacillus halophilus TaxID=517424 RepID=A0A2P8HFT0_9BACI|nr:Na+/H+ antiporter subunit A [Salsuginibacillus halophilus]PSL45061.1 multisubunit sodium/proton antiporter MrpA subunit [Salsuginibacillus halophilus]